MTFIPVTPMTDDSGHWYIVPKELENEFFKNLDNEEMAESGEFGEKYDHLRTGGDLNNIQLYVEKEDLDNL